MGLVHQHLFAKKHSGILMVSGGPLAHGFAMGFGSFWFMGIAFTRFLIHHQSLAIFLAVDLVEEFSEWLSRLDPALAFSPLKE